MTSDPRTESVGDPVSATLLELARSHTRGDVERNVHVTSRVRLLETYARGTAPRRGWPLLAAAAAGGMTLGAVFALRHESITKDERALSTEPGVDAASRSSPPISNADEVIAALRPR